MNDDRLSALDGANGLGPTLLRAGRDDWPSDESLARTLTAIGASAAVVAVTGGAAAGAGASAGTAAKGGVAILSFGSLAKWLGMGAVSGVLVAGVAHEITPPAGPRLDGATVSAAPPTTRKSVTTTEEPTQPDPVLIPAPTSEPEKAAVTPHSDRATDDPLEPSAPLAAEVAMVDRARAALASKDPTRALGEIAGYEAAFREPRLQPEVLYLRMEAYLAAGNVARAREAAGRSVKLFPRSPHAARAREVLDQGGATAPKEN